MSEFCGIFNLYAHFAQGRRVSSLGPLNLVNLQNVTKKCINLKLELGLN